MLTVRPRGVVSVSTDGLGALSVGSARIRADGPIAGVVRFQIPGFGITGVGDSQPLTRFLIPVSQNRAGMRSGIALINTAEAPVTVNLLLRNKAGAIVPGGTVNLENLAPRAHLARFVDELFPDAATEDLEGTVSVAVSGGTVAATALEMGSGPGQLTTLPVTPVE